MKQRLERQWRKLLKPKVSYQQTYKPLARLTKKNRKTQITEITSNQSKDTAGLAECLST
jgi:hypothetical protein